MKAALRRSWCAATASAILNEISDMGTILKKPSLRADMPHMVHAALASSCTAQRLSTAWRHLVDAAVPGTRELWVEEATKRHVAGKLFDEAWLWSEQGEEEPPAEEEVVEDEEEQEQEQEPGADELPELPADEPPLNHASRAAGGRRGAVASILQTLGSTQGF